MSVVISELEHRPAGEGASEGVPAGATASPAAVRIDGEQVLAALRREASRRARLWAD
jgi:hypothetical protein